MSDERLFLEHYLSEQDVPCPGCGYNLRGLKGAECPECGQALRLNVGLVEPRLASFIMGLIGLVLGLGFHFILLGLTALVAMNGGFGGWHDLWPSLVGGLLALVGTPAWIIRRKEIQRANRATTWGLVALCWFITLGSVGWLVAIILS
ncbi:MAG: hypothetical protein KF757_00900 [Phycisphaeraceae bacterium]|nr:hypothetical protein [Phycisphaeraceae bacterium]MCW5761765.1 hypothetical protein [Phycisphaeraceae bacterium]